MPEVSISINVEEVAVDVTIAEGRISIAPSQQGLALPAQDLW